MLNATILRHGRQKPLRRSKPASAARYAVVRRAPQIWPSRHLGRLLIDGRAYPCALGRTGISGQKMEGDGATPRTSTPMIAGLWRADKMIRPSGAGSFWTRIDPRWGWGDAAFTPTYNQPVRLPYVHSHEKLARDDHLYDRVWVLDWNVRQRAQGRGSAIFLHQARIKDGQLQPTEGCIALEAKMLDKISGQLSRLKAIRVL